MKVKKKKLFAIVVMGLLANVAWGAGSDCPEIRLDTQDGPMQNVPVTFQGHVGICYGHAAAQMIDAYRFSHGDENTSELSSPLEIAIGVTETTSPKDDFTDGAYDVCPSIHYAAERGTCSEAWVAQLYSSKGIERSDFTDRLSKLQSDVSSSPKDALELATAAETDFASYASAGARDVLPNASELAKDAEQSDFTRAAYDFIEAYCKDKARIEVPSGIRCEEPKNLSGQEIMQKVHALLLVKNAQPVAIKMCRNIFEAGHTYVGVTADGMKDDCQLHWPLIIGQKKIGGKCRFLVRNSFGTDDTGYSKDWLPREHGNLWIDEDTLANNTMQMGYIDPQGQ